MGFARAAALALALICAAPRALAQPAPSEADKVQADALIRTGVALRKQGKESEALDRFTEAYKLDGSARALGQMGLAAKSLRLWVEAERYLEGALATRDDAWVESNRSALDLALEIVRKNLASLRVESNAAKATLFIDGRQVTELPDAHVLRVPAGATTIEVRAPGYHTLTRTETLAAGRETTLRFDLQPESAPIVPAPEPKPAPVVSPPPADDAGADKPGETQRTLALVAGGVGVVGLGVGTYFGIRTISLKNERDEICGSSQCSDDRGVELDEDARSAALVSTIAFGVGALALGGAAVLWFSAPESTDKPSVAAGVGPGSATLRVRF